MYRTNLEILGYAQKGPGGTRICDSSRARTAVLTSTGPELRAWRNRHMTANRDRRSLEVLGYAMYRTNLEILGYA